MVPRLKHIILSLLPLTCFGQGYVETWNAELQQPPASFSLDSEDNLYVGFEDGTLRKFSSSGSELYLFSLPRQSAISFVEAQNNRKIFLFQRDIQEISLLDRFNTIPKKYPLIEMGISFGQAAGISPDGTFWISEINPPLLKKIDPLRNLVIHEVQHALGNDVSIIRTISSLILIVDETGLHILDQFGNLNAAVALSEVSHIQVLSDEVLCTTPGGYVSVDPRTFTILSESTDSIFAEKKAIFKTKQQFVLLDESSIRAIQLN